MENQLEIIVKDSGLEKTKADFILTKFKDYFELAADWERRAKTIVVTDEKQTDDMKMARTGRLLLREKRLAIESSRKELKEQSLREGKAIDGIANVLKALIVPIEEYLEKQEKFVEFKEAERKELIRIEVEKKMEEERIAKEKAEAEEREKIRLENERLKAEALAKEKELLAERKRQEELLQRERAKADAERKAIEEKARIDREQQAKKLAEERAKAENERKIAEAKAQKEREIERAKAESERKEKERLAEILKNTVKCPHCNKEFSLSKN